MQKFARTCSPEQLHTLQVIFDLIQVELRESSTSKYSGPSEPDALRDEIAHRVLSQFDAHGFSGDEVTKRVLSSFGFQAAVVGSANTGMIDRILNSVWETAVRSNPMGLVNMVEPNAAFSQLREMIGDCLAKGLPESETREHVLKELLQSSFSNRSPRSTCDASASQGQS
jgi:hypothetical protein